jgi:SAM-dependent methyltransferase
LSDFDLAAFEEAIAATGGLDAATVAFARRMFAGGLARYEKRLRHYGFAGLKNVLDAGCGFGQWSLALAQLNDSVDAVDHASARVALLQHIAARMDITKLRVQQASVDELPYPDASFAAVFAYSLLPFTEWKRTVRELTRVLAPGGRLYANANDFGWYKFLWYTEHNKGAGYDPRAIAGRTLLNTHRYRQGEPTEPGLDILIEVDELTQELTSRGCVITEIAAEGCAGGAGTPFFPGEFRGDRAVYEIIATKAS